MPAKNFWNQTVGNLFLTGPSRRRNARRSLVPVAAVEHLEERVLLSATPYTSPAAPSGLQVTSQSDSHVSLSWQDNSTNETRFQIERSHDGGQTFFLVATFDKTGTGGTMTYTDTTVAAGTQYTYRVRAEDRDTTGIGQGTRHSDWSSTVSVTTPATTTPQSPVAAAATSLVVDSADGTYGGTTDLSATLSSVGSPVAGQTVSFSIAGTVVGSAVTDASGVATLSGVSLAGLNAGEYAIDASFAGVQDVWVGSADSSTLVIAQKQLDIDVTTQSSLNIAKAGTITLAINLTDAEQIVDGQTVAQLFNGSTLSFSVEGTSFDVDVAATVIDGTIYVSYRMSADLQNALLSVLSGNKTLTDCLTVSGSSNDNNYAIDGSAWVRLFSQGKLTFPVV